MAGKMELTDEQTAWNRVLVEELIAAVLVKYVCMRWRHFTALTQSTSGQSQMCHASSYLNLEQQANR
jgi:hypothetical protein